MSELHHTTVLAVRRGATVALGSDGQVTLGNTVIKHGAAKVRTLKDDDSVTVARWTVGQNPAPTYQKMGGWGPDDVVDRWQIINFEAPATIAIDVGVAPADTYLRQDLILHAADRTGADAVHPGYGFLAENAEFSEICARSGLVFIGPTPDTLALFGDTVAVPFDLTRGRLDCPIQPFQFVFHRVARHEPPVERSGQGVRAQLPRLQGRAQLADEHAQLTEPLLLTRADSASRIRGVRVDPFDEVALSRSPCMNRK